MGEDGAATLNEILRSSSMILQTPHNNGAPPKGPIQIIYTTHNHHLKNTYTPYKIIYNSFKTMKSVFNAYKKCT